MQTVAYRGDVSKTIGAYVQLTKATLATISGDDPNVVEFRGADPDEITKARTDWEAQRRFGEVTACNGPRLNAPSLTRFARPNPIS